LAFLTEREKEKTKISQNVVKGQVLFWQRISKQLNTCYMAYTDMALVPYEFGSNHLLCKLYIAISF